MTTGTTLRTCVPRRVVSPPTPSGFPLQLTARMLDGPRQCHGSLAPPPPLGSGRGRKQQALICELTDCTSRFQHCANNNKLLAAPCRAGWVIVGLGWLRERVGAGSNQTDLQCQCHAVLLPDACC